MVTDTSRDHIYTDWKGLDGFVAGFIAELNPPPVAGEAPHTAELVGAYRR